MKVALVHDYLSQDGGAERVLTTLQEIWPDAPTYVWFYDEKKFGDTFKNKDIRPSFIHHLPFGKTHYQWYLPLLPYATEQHTLNEFDVVISSSSSFAKGVITRPTTLHISYCHTPPRYLWTETHQYVDALPYNSIFKKLIILPFLGRLRLWDKMSADRVDHFVANSETVYKRIQKYYRKESTVIYPPVDTHSCCIAEKIEDYFLAGGRLMPYKKVALVLDVFNRLKWPLKVFGIGSEVERLKKQAGPTVEILGKISEQEKMQLFAHARAYIQPQIEDFGITAVESMACGRPVIAFPTGGASETIIPGHTGLFFTEQTWESLLDILLTFDSYTFHPEEIRSHALQFSKERFKEEIQKFVLDRFEEFQKGMKQKILAV